ncbi:solute carrier organic anion transporter family member 1C1 isoform X1 [Anolis carolinensis]|uniref:Solute carrier organic anion transporter family member n=2 Tax=Anolis carolinensis TaxID=28377 RepID=G1KTZ8_ANOCA|nr:PREDICTED: solute carrier organic anion transporter family member 1C1 [Anolis carolinensis]XP_008108572.1 PREDICTED: solute carrier organic anion transporter family member 1C1 [Anolis carolinensis]XP_008108573.1 PREDICTED: solute carrier organic anion transporter family member 1C1 [Anolis carolinensis]|eukprot:XP_008108571.1 PREDICTED: solute carrier organic anion transporter family member 1C1 [Anolis carolinensis]
MEGKATPQQAKDGLSFMDKSLGSHPMKRISLTLSKLKMFLIALAFSYFAKGFSGSYMKSMMTQIERRFEIPSSVAGLIDGSFEIGNLLVLVLVSYLGPKVHRPKVIAVGCFIMSIGAFLSVVPHFIMGRYNFKSIADSMANSSASVSACSPESPLHNGTGNLDALECEKAASSSLWVFVLAGNLLRGIGEAPIMPLGMSYIDDFSTEENSAFYIGTVRSVGMFGPTLGFLLGALCANLWVDIGMIDLDTLTINSKDTRWVGAWWIGLLLGGGLSFMASLPFWFLPYSLPKEGEVEVIKKSSDVFTITKEGNGKTEPPNSTPSRPQLKISEAAKEFFPALKKLFGNSIYLVYLLLTVLQFNSLVGMITYEPKFMEQQFNISISRAIFLIGVILLPITVVGMFLGGFLIKKLKLNTPAMAKFACISFLLAYLVNLLYFATNCQVLQVAGLTVNYSGVKEPSFSQIEPLSACNADCSCEDNHWDPVCGSNGITYMSACLAGCRGSVGSGKDMVFHNCSCVGESGPGNFSAVLGQCQRDSCTKNLPYFLLMLSVVSFILALGGTPLYMLIFRTVSPELKSFAVGIETLCGRVLGGLPAPIYYGALIDLTCLKWSKKTCGGSGTCRMYDTKAFRNVYLGLNSSIRLASCLLYIIICVLIMRRFRRDHKKKNTNGVPEGTSFKVSTSAPKKEDTASGETSVHGDTYL